MTTKIQFRSRFKITSEKLRQKKGAAGPGVVVNGENQQEREIKSPRRQKDEWVISIKEKVGAAGQDNAAGSWEQVSIYRVPQHLRHASNDKAYTPQVVSLGPYHHDTASLQKMERHKWRALHRVCHRTGEGVDIYFHAMKRLTESARACYEPPSDQRTDEQFAEMMLLDGCFILEILQGTAGEFKDLGYAENDPIFSMQRLTFLGIQRDMLRLENQIPLFVLDKLLELQPKVPDGKADAASLAIIAFFHSSNSKDKTTQKTIQCEQSSGGLHLLDVLRRCHFKTESEPEADEGCQKPIHCVTHELKDDDDERMTDGQRNRNLPTQFTACDRKNSSRNSTGDERYQEPIHCVTELKDANIKIKKQETGSIWDIKFENGTLHIPPIVIDDGTKSLFCNLIAFEQCHYEKDVTSYVLFLDHLINSAEDVKYLHKHGIIEHWLGSNTEVSDLINCLCKEVVFDTKNSPLSPIYKKINEYYRRPWNASRATLKERYFNNPWSIISLMAAVFLLIMTVAQTYFAFCGYYWPAK